MILRSGHNLSLLSCQHIGDLQCEEKINTEIKMKMGWPTLFSFLCVFIGFKVNSKFQTIGGPCISVLAIRHAFLCSFKTFIVHRPALVNTVLFSSNRMATLHVPIGSPTSHGLGGGHSRLLPTGSFWRWWLLDLCNVSLNPCLHLPTTPSTPSCPARSLLERQLQISGQSVSWSSLPVSWSSLQGLRQGRNEQRTLPNANGFPQLQEQRCASREH